MTTNEQFPYLLELAEKAHAEAGHAGTFQGCTLGDCPERCLEWQEAVRVDDYEELTGYKGDAELFLKQLEELDRWITACPGVEV